VRRRIPLGVLILVGIVVGSLLGLAGAAVFSGGDGDDVAHLSLSDATGDEAAAHQAAEEAFLVAWRRYRTATYSAELVFERVAKDGQSLRSSSTYIQQPPRRLVRDADSALLTAGADSRTCNRVNGVVACAPAPNVDYAAGVDAEIATWKTALEGAVPYYVVSEPQPNCFQLDLAAEVADPPYGEVARFCFDNTTGALTQRQIVRPTATDTEETASITTVIPADAFTATLADTPTTTTNTPTTNTPPTTR
jgi:hypothetical protein